MIKALLMLWWFTVFDKSILLIAHFYMSLTADSSLLTGPNWSTTVSVWNLISTGDNVHGGHISDFFCCHFKLTFYITGVLEPAYCLPLHSPTLMLDTQPALFSTHIPRHTCLRFAFYWVRSSSCSTLLQTTITVYKLTSGMHEHLTPLSFINTFNSLDVFSCSAYFT